MKKAAIVCIVVMSLALFSCSSEPDAIPTETAVPPATATTEPTMAPTATETMVPTETTVPSPTVTATPALGVGSTLLRESDGMTMMYVPAGEFEMGYDLQENVLFVQRLFGPLTNDQLRTYQDEEPIHTVYLDSYWIDQTEVTNGMYAQCVEAGVCSAPALTSSATREDYYDNPEYADFPVINVSRNDGVAYCEWAGAQLVTEAQWEKAARGEEGYIFPWGDEMVNCELANVWMIYEDKPKAYCVGDTVAVGSYPDGASPYGALDMAGNAAEWVFDWYDTRYYGDSPTENPTGPETGAFYTMVGGEWVWEYGAYNVVRGGGWSNFQHNNRSLARGAWATEWGVMNNTGFRCSQPAP